LTKLQAAIQQTAFLAHSVDSTNVLVRNPQSESLVAVLTRSGRHYCTCNFSICIFIVWSPTRQHRWALRPFLADRNYGE